MEAGAWHTGGSYVSCDVTNWLWCGSETVVVSVIKISPSLSTDSRPDRSKQFTCSPNSLHLMTQVVCKQPWETRVVSPPAGEETDTQSGCRTRARWQGWPDGIWGSCPDRGLQSLPLPPQRTTCQAHLPVLQGGWGHPWSPWGMLAEYVKGRRLSGETCPTRLILRTGFLFLYKTFLLDLLSP